MIKCLELKKFKKFRDKSISINPVGVTLLAGSNNSGKSSVLHALAVWQFCRTVIYYEKGKNALLRSANAKGCGISLEEFTPIAIPKFNHLWLNLKSQQEQEDTDGYTLRIKCIWDTKARKNCELEFGLSLANDRLFIKTTESNLNQNDRIPNIAYLPPFAGITEKEKKVSRVERSRQIGKGLAGSVIRNLIYDLYDENLKGRKKLQGEKKRLSKKDMEVLRTTDGYELLNANMRKMFGSNLVTKQFNEYYHANIDISHYKGCYTNGKFKKYNGYLNRDIMSEGSGYLQWLSVLALAVDEGTDVLLLDEPDAHLHASLQKELFRSLDSILTQKPKQILVATHSSDLLKSFELGNIMRIEGSSVKYISREEQRVAVINGLGSSFTPRLNRLQTSKKMLMVENESDARILRSVSEKIGTKWPDDLVIWDTTDSHKHRKLLFYALKKDIPELKVISLRDRDTEPYRTVESDLIDKSCEANDPNIKLLKWRRKHIESYLLVPEALARTAEVDIGVIEDFLSSYALNLSTVDVRLSDVCSALYNCEAKEIISEGEDSFTKRFSKNKYDIIENLKEGEVCEDFKTILKYIEDLSID